MCGGRLREASYQGYMDSCLYEQLRRRTTRDFGSSSHSLCVSIRELFQAGQATVIRSEKRNVEFLVFLLGSLKHHQGERKEGDDHSVLLAFDFKRGVWGEIVG